MRKSKNPNIIIEEVEKVSKEQKRKNKKLIQFVEENFNKIPLSEFTEKLINHLLENNLSASLEICGKKIIIEPELTFEEDKKK